MGVENNWLIELISIQGDFYVYFILDLDFCVFKKKNVGCLFSK